MAQQVELIATEPFNQSLKVPYILINVIVACRVPIGVPPPSLIKRQYMEAIRKHPGKRLERPRVASQTMQADDQRGLWIPPTHIMKPEPFKGNKRIDPGIGGVLFCDRQLIFLVPLTRMIKRPFNSRT